MPPPKDPLAIVDLSWARLRLIATNPSFAAWRTVLSMYNGVYVIRDSTNGDLYVGATFKSILSCWDNDYVQGLGKAKVRLRDLGPEHLRQHMRWSVDRVFPLGTPAKDIHRAETQTKLKLGSRVHGLNSN